MAGCCLGYFVLQTFVNAKEEPTIFCLDFTNSSLFSLDAQAANNTSDDEDDLGRISWILSVDWCILQVCF